MLWSRDKYPVPGKKRTQVVQPVACHIACIETAHNTLRELFIALVSENLNKNGTKQEGFGKSIFTAETSQIRGAEKKPEQV
jgi:hypothetical protein